MKGLSYIQVLKQKGSTDNLNSKAWGRLRKTGAQLRLCLEDSIMPLALGMNCR